MNDHDRRHDAEHAWVQRRLLLHANHLLGEADEARVAAHLETCDRCESMLAALRDTADRSPENEGHIPAAQISRWPHVVASTRGRERTAIRAHLLHCDACRDDLVALGHDPILPVIDELEEKGARLVDRAATATPARERVHAEPKHPLPRLAWLLGGWGVAATTAAMILVVRLGSLGSGLATSPLLEPGFDSRGIARLPSGAREVVLRIPREMLEAPDSAPVTVRLLTPRNGQTFDRHGTIAEMSSPNVLLLRDRSEFDSGEYRIVVLGVPVTDTLLDERFEVQVER